MRKVKFALLVLLCTSSLVSVAQKNYGIRNIFAFYTERMPGNIPADIDGKSSYKGPDTLITIYVESVGKGPVWETVWRNSKTYNVSVYLISQIPFEAGTRSTDGKKVIIAPFPGNKLWQLSLQETSNKIIVPRKIKPGELLLGGRYNGKSIFKRVKSLFQLTSPPSV
jgi:hypothetical protein